MTIRCKNRICPETFSCISHLRSIATRATALLITVLVLSGCGSGVWYEDARAFQQDVQSWGRSDAGIGVVVKKLQENGFACVEAGKDEPRTRCARQAEKFPCTQDQIVLVETELGGTAVKSIMPVVLRNGELPTRCL